MKLRILVVAVTAAALLAFAGAAVAKKKKPKAHTNTLTGKLAGLDNTKLTLKIRVNKKGRPTKISSSKITGAVTIQCVNPATGVVTPDQFDPGSLGKFAIVKVKSKGKTFYRFNLGGTAGRPFSGGGELSSKKAKKAKGAILYQYNGPAGVCNRAFEFTVKTKKKKKK